MEVRKFSSMLGTAQCVKIIPENITLQNCERSFTAVCLRILMLTAAVCLHTYLILKGKLTKHF